MELYYNDDPKSFAEIFPTIIEDGEVKAGFTHTGVILFCRQDFAYLIATNAYINNAVCLRVCFPDKTEAEIAIDEVGTLEHFIVVKCFPKSPIDTNLVKAVEFDENKLAVGKVVCTFHLKDFMAEIEKTPSIVGKSEDLFFHHNCRASTYTKEGSPVMNKENKFVGLCFDDPCGILAASTVRSIANSLSDHHNVADMGITEILNYIYRLNIPLNEMASHGTSQKRPLQKDSFGNNSQHKCKRTKPGSITVDMGIHFRDLSIPECQNVLPISAKCGLKTTKPKLSTLFASLACKFHRFGPLGSGVPGRSSLALLQAAALTPHVHFRSAPAPPLRSSLPCLEPNHPSFLNLTESMRSSLPAMASSSTSDGPSTSGRRSEWAQYWNYFVPPVLPNTNVSDDPLEKLLLAVENLDIVKVRKLAEKLKGTRMSLDAAVVAIVEADPKSKRHGPLHEAALTNYVEMCSMLVKDYECNPNATDPDDATPLHFAILMGSQALVEYLIQSGADPNKANNVGLTPLHYAASRGYCEIAKYLLSNGAHVDPICQDGESPLHAAARCGHARMVGLLLERHTDRNSLSFCYHTPLVESLYASELECFGRLIEAHADVNTSPVTPLSVAARKGLANCIERLLENYANPNERDDDGKLPIEIAASKGWKRCIEILLPPVTEPLEKFAPLSIDQMVQQETDACLLEERRAIVAGNVAYWKEEYAEARASYTLALKLGHDDATLYAKKSLCYLHDNDELRSLNDAVVYMSKNRDLSRPISKENARQSVLDFEKEWKARRSGLK